MSDKASEQTAPARVAKAVTYKLKNIAPAVSVKHRHLGDITDDMLAGENAWRFIKAIKRYDETGDTKGFYANFIEEVK